LIIDGSNLTLLGFDIREQMKKKQGLEKGARKGEHLHWEDAMQPDWDLRSYKYVIDGREGDI